ncbi:virulence factor [Pseudomonas sp. MTM4]|uniref:murein biosynthesis integral membrane protein MurJ n=1 Tax=unclassified Pseudomonas TaxID=196821 RepID=UPI0018D20EEA|nr:MULTISPECIES: lipid II flippase MurJ [unclassified Pseudomonas]MBC8649377.1 virulence factor [Pseudomonas sp. MT4]QXY90718.1 virulence factor [Pseudomonas sp. MTM4]
MNASLVILALTVASFLLGFLRDLFIAKAFGLSWEADLIFVALILPMFFENFLGLALRDAMIPYLQKLRSQSQALFETVSRWLYWRVMGMGAAVSAVAIAGSYWILNLLAPGWSDAQVATGQIVFCVGAALIAVQAVLYCQGALLNMDEIFILPMTRTVLLNAGAIIGILLFQPTGMVIFIGMLLPQLALIWLQHRRIAYLRGSESVETEGHRGSFGLAFAPVLLAAGAQQGCILAERMFASYLDEGSITMLSFAFRIVTIPLTLYALSVLSVLFPRFVSSWNDGDYIGHAAVIRKGLLATLLFLVPATVVLCSFPQPVVSVLLERGQFGAAQTDATASLVVLYSLGLPAMGLALLWGRTLLAQHQSRLFLVITLVSSALTISLDALLYGPYGAEGLAFAFSSGAALQALFMGLYVYRASPTGLAPSVLLRWITTGVTVAALLHWLPTPHGLLQLCLYIALMLCAFAAGVVLLGERDLFRPSYWSMKKA